MALPRLPNLLATRRGRLGAFFALYITEGIPLGFAVTAIASYLRRQGIGPAEIGAFVGSFYLPWAFKWAFGPLVDVFRSQRFGHRRAWILGTQVLMALTLFSLVAVDLPSQLFLFTAILFVHNTFGAMQDVAIDALACNSLQEDERGLANGLMFAGAAVGQAIGGSGVLFLTPYTGFQVSFLLVALAILSVTGLIVWPMREQLTAPLQQVQANVQTAGARWRTAAGEMRQFALDAFRSFLGTRGAYAGVLFSLLPAGAMSLGLALQSNLAVEMGLDDNAVARLSLYSQVIAAVSMVIGGFLSDKLGRRRTLFVYLALMSAPVVYLAQVLQSHGYVMPRAPGSSGLAPALATALWVATLVYNIFLGLMYGTRTAIMMDVTSPRVAGTQFTAYMAMANLAIAYSATWMGVAVEAIGYPKTLLLDALLGWLNLALIFWLKPATQAEAADLPARRARRLALALGVLVLLWLPFQALPGSFGAARPILTTFFTLCFVGGALVLLAGAWMLPASGWTRRAPWLALGLLLLTTYRFVPTAWTGHALWGFGAVLVAASLTLLAMSRMGWQAMRRSDAPTDNETEGSPS